jgi:hypothetical protein
MQKAGMRIRSRLLSLPQLSLVDFGPHWSAEMQLSRFVAMMGSTMNEKVERA